MPIKKDITATVKEFYNLKQWAEKNYPELLLHVHYPRKDAKLSDKFILTTLPIETDMPDELFKNSPLFKLLKDQLL